jgi:type VI secretion system protein VasD
MIHRRDFIILLGAGGVVAACTSTPKPTVVNVSLRGQAGMNPGPAGDDRSVTVLLLRLRSAGTFNSADYFALQGNPSGALGGDLVGMDQVVVAPGGTASRTIGFEAEATHLGVVALLREPGGRNWRATRSVPAEKTSNVNVALGSGGLSVSG